MHMIPTLIYTLTITNLILDCHNNHYEHTWYRSQKSCFVKLQLHLDAPHTRQCQAPHLQIHVRVVV